MRSSIFGRWVRSKKFLAYVVLPSTCSLLFTIMYFSGSSFLQGLVSPSYYGLDHQIWTKFGLLELAQLFLLLCIMFFGLRCFLSTKQVPVGIIVACMMVLTLFVILQEIGFGKHYMDYMNKPIPPARYEPGTEPVAALRDSAEEVASIIGIGISGGAMILFLVLPIFASSRNPLLRLLIPGPWFMVGALAALLMYALAWKLEDGGHGIVEGYRGALSYDMGEFLQFSVYYLTMIYMVTLHERIHFRENRPTLKRSF